MKISLHKSGLELQNSQLQEVDSAESNFEKNISFRKKFKITKTTGCQPKKNSYSSQNVYLFLVFKDAILKKSLGSMDIVRMGCAGGGQGNSQKVVVLYLITS